MSIAFLDLRPAYLELKPEIDSAVARVMDSGWYILGEEVEAFEAEWGAYCDAKYAVGVGSGLDALHLALIALGVGPGDEVIVPSHTFIATWLAVSHCGATPVPVEPEKLTYNIDPALIEAAITPRTKVILAAHLYGQPADLDPIIEVARKYGIRVVEDAAQAHGAYYKGKRIGSHGDVVCWSFYPGKNLGAMGDGGAITSNDKLIADRVRSLSNYGSSEKYIHNYLGFNSRLDPIQAAILRVKLSKLDEWNARRNAIANVYLSIKFSDLVLPYVPSWADPVWHLFVVRFKKRDLLMQAIDTIGFDTQIHYPEPIFMQQPYIDNGYNFPLSKNIAKNILSIPIGPHLNIEDAKTLAQALSGSISL